MMSCIQKKTLFFVTLLGLGLGPGLPSAHAFVFMDGGTCVPGSFYGVTCLYSNYFAHQGGGLSLVPTLSSDGNSVSGTLDDERFAFTTGTTAFLTGSADLATGQLKVQANSIQGTSVLFAALRTGLDDILHLTGSTDADGIADGLYSITLNLIVHGDRATDFTNPSSVIFNSLIDLNILPANSVDSLCHDFALLPDLVGGNADVINRTISLQCAVPADFRFSAELQSGRVSDGFFNAGSTAQLSLTLPTGVSFTSDSGVLLSQVDTPSVPEPATLALLVFGLAGLGICRRKRSELPSPKGLIMSHILCWTRRAFMSSVVSLK